MKLLRMALSAIFGIPLLIIGIILIPLPGPGLLICFGALFILSLGFDSAKKYFDQAKRSLLTIYEKAKQQGEKVEKRLNKDD